MCPPPPPLPLWILLWNPPLLTLLILIRLHQNHEIYCCYQNNYGARCTVVLDKYMQRITAWCFIVLLQKHKIFTLIWFDSIRLTHVIWYNDIYSLIVVHLIWLFGRFDSLWRELTSWVLISFDWLFWFDFIQCNVFTHKAKLSLIGRLGVGIFLNCRNCKPLIDLLIYWFVNWFMNTRTQTNIHSI